MTSQAKKALQQKHRNLVVFDNNQSIQDTMTQADAIIQRKRGLFPSKFKRVLNDHELTIAVKRLETMENTYSLVVKTQLHAMQEMFNSYLETGKAINRRERAEFFASQLQQLELEVHQITDNFIEDIQSQFLKKQKITIQYLKQKEEIRLINSIDRYFETADQLLIRFQNILNEGLMA